MAHLPALTVTSLDRAPELEPAVDRLITGNMPAFMSWESPGNWRWHRLYDTYPAHQLCVLDEEGRLVAAANGLPVPWDGTVDGLPGGSDDVLVSAFDGPAARPDALCMLSVSVCARLRGSGLAERLLTRARDEARAAGLRGVVIPVRPTRKARYPLVPMADYARWRRPDGTPFDPWLATHAALGAELLAPCDRSLVISQPAARWEEIAGHPLPGPARHLVPGALAPLEVSADGEGVYAEPNFWVFHPAT
ncbi:GNAT family N-acetyltransferase [Streptomyces sp. NPDC021562]|uniref:GNAT family N-acetyltransferase n=1 Tax=Streptomyces sp. NPDC021562 TaxID=3155121 RepID=UPI0010E14B58